MDEPVDDCIDLGLVNTNDDSEVFLKTPERRRRSSIIPSGLHARRLSSTYSTPSTPDLTERQSRNKSIHVLSPLARSRTLPRSYLKSPVHEVFSSCLPDAPALDAEIVSKLRRWIICTVVVNFDLDLGPAVDRIYPSCPLSAQERDTICFSSFPDSPVYEEGTETFSFRIRECAPSQADSPDQEERTRLSQDGFIYGFSYFSRRKDETSIRGYDQRSLVVLTAHPWPSMFCEMVNRLGPMYIVHGDPMLESASHNIASWPAPDPGSTIELGFLGTVLHVELPGSIDQQQITETTSFQEKFNPSLHILASMAPIQPSPLRLFAASITHIWSMWECIVLNEPLLIFGTSPTMTSQAIWWILDILRPIPFVADFRPYFTIHDKDFRSLVNKKYPKVGLLLGVTNPIFASSCKDWPHKLSLGIEGHGKPSHGERIRMANIAGPPPGWETRTHNRYISKDRDLLKLLENEIRKGSTMDADGKLTLLLRRHFTTRAVQFLVPLNRYLNTLIPAPARGLSSANSSNLPSLKPFNRDHFFASLKAHGTPLPFRSSAKQKEFYERWLRSPAFGLWMARQEEAINAILRRPA